MIKEKFNANGNYLKMNILFLLLIISNVVLLAGLIYYYSRAGIGFRIETYEYFSSVIPTIIILGFITSKLANLREREGSLYEMAYLVIITILGLMTSYFSAKSNTEVIFGSYLEMFRMLCVILIFVLIALKLKPFRQIMHGDYSRRNLLVCFIIFAVFGISASIFYIDVNGTPANVRCMVVMLSGMFGGPFVGIPVGIVSGAYRFTLGGATALPCAISTVISGIVGSLIFWWSGRKYPRPIAAVAAMFFFTGFEMLVVIMMTPPEISFPFITGIYPIMLFSSVIGVILFSIVVQDRLAQGDSTDEDVVEQLGDEISRSGGIQDLKDEITWLKSEINKLKKD
jgi:two-component system LytT family sensor kinase